MRYRQPYDGKDLAPWVSSIPDDTHGVYVIRSPDRVLYVGESHTGRLRKTMLRHFQKWNGPTASPTYKPGRVTVGVIQVKDPERAVAVQLKLIARLKPRDNVYSKPKPKWSHKRERRGAQAEDLFSHLFGGDTPF